MMSRFNVAESAHVVQPQVGQRPRRKARTLIIDVLLVALLAGGVGVLVYFNAASWHARFVAENSISELSAKSDDLGEEGRLEVKNQALAYNASLLDADENAEVWPYEQQLLFDREPMMSYIVIPAIDVKLPIYHGTSDAALMAGVGHLQNSALPVGGPDSHCVLTGHTGMHGTRMFDGLVDLKEGDTFVIWTLSEPYAYRVSGIEVVEPDDLDSLGVVDGKDLCTLVTCTPYGVNSHRLLVHGERCEYVPDRDDEPAMYVDERQRSLLVALVPVLLLGVAAVARIVRQRKQRRLFGTSDAAHCNAAPNGERLETTWKER